MHLSGVLEPSACYAYSHFKIGGFKYCNRSDDDIKGDRDHDKLITFHLLLRYRTVKGAEESTELSDLRGLILMRTFLEPAVFHRVGAFQHDWSGKGPALFANFDPRAYECTSMIVY